jgi:hypothetical protein
MILLHSLQVFGREFRISHDLTQQSASQVPTKVNRHGCTTSVRVAKDSVRSALPYLEESVAFQN